MRYMDIKVEGGICWYNGTMRYIKTIEIKKKRRR